MGKWGVGLVARYFFSLSLLICCWHDAVGGQIHCPNWLVRAASVRYWTNWGPYVAVVDPISSGRLLAERLTARGYRVIGVHSTQALPSAVKSTYHPRSVYRDIYLNGGTSVAEIEFLVEKLHRYQYPNVSREASLKAVFVGSENGVVAGEGAAALLGLDGNVPALSLAKRDKGLMQERLALFGVPHIPHVRATTLETILKWVGDRGKQAAYPIVLKPVDSAGTQGVSICENEAEVRAAFDGLMHGSTVFGTPIKEILAQVFLVGAEEDSEYVLNTASSGGRHIVTDVARYRKRRIQKSDGSHAAIYLFDDHLPLDHPVSLRLREYGFRVLDAEGVRFGPSHMEIMLTKDGPVLIEIGARPAGSGLPDLAGIAYTHHPLDLVIDAYLHPEKFDEVWRAESAAPGSVQKMRKFSRQVSLISRRAGGVKRIRFLNELMDRPSYVSHSFLSRGDKIQVTEDLMTAPGHVELAHEDPKVLELDYAWIRAREEGEGFFDLGDDPPVPAALWRSGQHDY